MKIIYFIGFCLLIALIGYIGLFIIEHYKVILMIISCLIIFALIIFIVKKIYDYKLNKKIEEEQKLRKKLYKERTHIKTINTNFVTNIKPKQPKNISESQDEFIKEEYNQELKIKQREYAKHINLKPEETKKYESKSLVSENEKYFLNIIENQFGQYYRIQPQVPLSSIVDKNKEFYKQYQNELYRTIDIGIFNKKSFEPLLMVEINDKTHKQANRHERDKKVREILNIANIPIITFYTNMPNKADYIINRIKENLSKSSK